MIENAQKKADGKGLGEENLRGIASLYSPGELKSFISSYLIMMGVVEGFIFFASWLSYLWSKSSEFPWKAYLIASFITPVAITFVFGVIVIGFNKYMFGKSVKGEKTSHLPEEGTKRGNKLDLFFYYIRQVPFLMGLLLLVLAGGIVYKLDAITLYIANAGEKAATYLFVSLSVMLGVATVVCLVWMTLSYNLRKKKLDYEHQYKKEVMEKTGMIILDDDSILDRDGRLVELQRVKELPPEKRNEDLTLIPKLPFRKS